MPARKGTIRLDQSNRRTPSTDRHPLYVSTAGQQVNPPCLSPSKETAMNSRLYVHAWQVGYDLLFSNPDEFLVRRCPTCGDEMDVERGRVGATSWGEAMARRSHRHDQFRCPNATLAWHGQAVRLRKEAANTASKTVRKLIRNELTELLRTRPDVL
jgi:hypothetical protein